MGALIKQEIFKALRENSELLGDHDGNDGAELSLDLQAIANSLGDKNEELKKILLENPEALNQLLFDNIEEMGVEEEYSEGSEPEMHEMELTEAEEQSIQKVKCGIIQVNGAGVRPLGCNPGFLCLREK